MVSCNQLRPVTLAGDQGNCFDSVIGQALFTRLETGGLDAVLLGTQHRFNSEINALISSIFYHNRLKAHQSCDARPTRLTLHSFNHKRFGIRSSIVFISAVNSNAECLGNSSSKYNEINLVIAMHLVEDLIRAKFHPKTIGILCPYQAQYSLYKKAINHLQHRYPQWKLSELLVQKFHGFQGGERSIIIADLVVDRYPGFLTQPNRLNVALSRARDALYIIGKVGAYEGNKNLRTSALMKIVTHCKLNNYDTIDDRTDTSAYVGADDSKEEDADADDSGDEDVGADDSEDEDVGEIVIN
ncbi:AAA domain-containing protein [Cenococcum geophilum]